MYNREILLTTKQSIKPDFTNDMSVFESINGDLYFYGGVYQNNVNRIVYKFIKSENRFVRYPELPVHTLVLCLYTLGEDVYIVAENTRYSFKQDQWVRDGTTSIDNPKSLMRDGVVYIIDDHKLYSVSESNSFSLIHTDNRINPKKYISSDSNIYFTNGYIDLNTLNFMPHDLSATKSDIITDGCVLKNTDDDLVFVTDDKTVIKPHDGSLCYRYGIADCFHIMQSSDYDELYAATSIVDLNDDILYFTTTNNGFNSVVSLNVRTLQTEVSLKLKIEDKSFSKRIRYNHTKPLALVLDEPVLVGNDGFYQDTSETDNSLYFKNTIVPLSFNIYDPVVMKYNEHVGIVVENEEHTSVNIIDAYGEVVNTIDMPNYSPHFKVFHNKRHFIYYNDTNITIADGGTLEPLDYHVVKVAVDEYFHFMVVKNSEGKYDLVKRAHYSGTYMYYEINMCMDEIIDIRSFNNRIYLLYVSDNDTVLEKVTLHG